MKLTRLVILAVVHGSACFAASGPRDAVAAERAQAALQRAATYLTNAQNADGAWEAFDQSHPGITALVISALADYPSVGPNHDSVRRGVEYLLKHVQPDGGIYVPEQGQQNYATSVALMALASLKDERHAAIIKRAQEFLKKLQWDDGEGHEASSPWYGGAGYGRNKRPDLSNTQLMLEALHQSGLPADDPVYQKALVFISRSQMLDATNDQPLADGAGDGGFIYTPANGGESMAGTVVEDRPRLRPYGSMTYAAFKSMLYAKVDRSDPRVVGAVGWIRRNYTLEQNPNMPEAQGQQGLYYYYHVFAKAMQAWGEDAVADDQGIRHSWRDDLTNALVRRQKDDGSWANEADRWYEGNPHLVTAYGMLALEAVLAPANAGGGLRIQDSGEPTKTEQ